MKWLGIGLLFLNLAWAKESKVVPAFIEASQIYIDSTYTQSIPVIWKPEVQKLLQLFEARGISPEFLISYADLQGPWPLTIDKFDKLLAQKQMSREEIPALAVHAFKLKVIEESDDFFNDDIYAYYFVTDGVVPTGKVTSLYKGLDQGDVLFFNEVDRKIFPLSGDAKSPSNHLIIDYGIIESDGDDMQELQKLSSIIVDMVIAVYAAEYPEGGTILTALRSEVKALAQALLSLNHDDRLVTGTLAFSTGELKSMLESRSYWETSRKHGKSSPFDSWEYELYFRILRK